MGAGPGEPLLHARRFGEAFGGDSYVVPMWKDRPNANTIVTTANPDVIYTMSYLDLKKGPPWSRDHRALIRLLRRACSRGRERRQGPRERRRRAGASLTRRPSTAPHARQITARMLRLLAPSVPSHRVRDAAHILLDGHSKGEPIVPNGLALCALHHAAFDRNILGIRPDFIVEVRADSLTEKDGPMLQHSLQGFQGTIILRPGSRVLWPRSDFLAERYEEFRRAS